MVNSLIAKITATSGMSLYSFFVKNFFVVVLLCFKIRVMDEIMNVTRENKLCMHLGTCYPGNKMVFA